MPEEILDNPGQDEILDNPGPTDDPSLGADDPQPTDPPAGEEPQPPAKPANWYDDLSADIKANPSIKKFAGKEEMAKSYLELQSLLGHKRVALPKNADDKVAIANLKKALGVPEDPTGYKLDEPEPIPGLESVQFGMDEFKAVAHKNGLTPAQAEGLRDDYMGMLTGIYEKSVKDHMASVEAAKAELTKEWGLAFESKVKLAQDVMNKFAGGKENFDHINAVIGSDPIALKWLASIGENFSEGSLGDIGGQRTTFTKTPAEAKIEYEAIMNDPDDIYWSGVRNQKPVSETVRKERISHVESLLRMQQPAG